MYSEAKKVLNWNAIFFLAIVIPGGVIFYFSFTILGLVVTLLTYPLLLYVDWKRMTCVPIENLNPKKEFKKHIFMFIFVCIGYLTLNLGAFHYKDFFLKSFIPFEDINNPDLFYTVLFNPFAFILIAVFVTLVDNPIRKNKILKDPKVVEYLAWRKEQKRLKKESK